MGKIDDEGLMNFGVLSKSSKCDNFQGFNLQLELRSTSIRNFMHEEERRVASFVLKLQYAI